MYRIALRRAGPDPRIGLRPRERAAHLAAEAGLDKARFKVNVRTVEGLGLTESLDVGYRLSPRGEAVLARLRDARRLSGPSAEAGPP